MDIQQPDAITGILHRHHPNATFALLSEQVAAMCEPVWQTMLLDNSPPLPSLAKKMLAFMIMPVFKPSLSFPVAAFSTTDLKGGRLFPMVWEVIEALELDNFPIITVTADGVSPNR